MCLPIQLISAACDTRLPCTNVSPLVSLLYMYTVKVQNYAHTTQCYIWMHTCRDGRPCALWCILVHYQTPLWSEQETKKRSIPLCTFFLLCSYTTAYVVCIRRVWVECPELEANSVSEQHQEVVCSTWVKFLRCGACDSITLLTTHSSHCNKWDLETKPTTNAAFLLWAQTLNGNSVWLLYWVWISAGSRHRPTVHNFNHLATSNPSFPIWILYHT